MERRRRVSLTLLIIAILASGAVACSGFSLFGGIAGGVLTVVAVVLWFATATTQSGCTVQTCLSLVAPDPPDSGIDAGIDAGIDGGVDAGRIGPCLSVINDMGVDTGVPDTGDGTVGPCLSAPPDAGNIPDGSEEFGALEPSNTPVLSRNETIDRLRARGILPADVAARLRGASDDEEA